MGTESDFWRDDVRKLRSFGEIDRIEDAIKLGVSDCIFCLQFSNFAPRAGWLELKRRQEWPVRPGTNVWLPHYTLDQANFLVRWGKAGMGAFLLAQVADEFLLFPWAAANEIQEGVSRRRMIQLAVCHAKGKFPHGRMLRCLTEI